MKRFSLVLSIITFTIAASYFFALGGENFLAKILRDGSYLLNLVNKENSVRKYAPPDLVELSELQARGQYIREAAYEPLKELMRAAELSGATLKVVSAYRSYERQEQVFEYWSNRDPYANTYSAEAGHSEHQLGTTVDFGLGNAKVDLRWEFGDTLEGKWLEENSWKYGFAMSYPKGKEGITGYVYEPWHFRYIGKEAARGWRESSTTLAEYLLTKPQYYRLIRRFDDYKVYSVDPEGTKHWITTAERFLSLGYNWDDIMIVPIEEFYSYREGNQL